MAHVDTIGSLTEGKLCQGLGDEQLDALSGIAEEIEFDKEEVLFKEGEEASNVFIVRDGKIALTFRFNYHNDELAVRFSIVEAGDTLGFSAVNRHNTYTATARAETPGRAWRIKGDDLRRTMDEQPKLGYHIANHMACLISGRLRDTREQLRVLLEQQQQ